MQNMILEERTYYFTVGGYYVVFSFQVSRADRDQQDHRM